MDSKRQNKFWAYQFERVPREIVYNILARLDAKSLASVKCVCKVLNNLLGHQALTLHCNSSISSAFLFKVVDYDSSETRKGYVMVDHQGRCHALHMFNTNIHLCPHWNVSSHGMLACFPPYKVGDGIEYNKIILSHPSLRWITQVALPLPSLFSLLSVIRGAYFDPSTFQFKLLFGFQRKGDTPSPYEIHLYSSASRVWTTTVLQEMSSRRCIEVQDINSVYSQGCFFWIERKYSDIQDKGLLIFNVSEGRFHRMQFPDCPFLPTDQRMSCRRHQHKIEGHEWKLKVCDRNLVLVHQGIEIGRRSTDVYFWRLEESEKKWRWNLELQIPQFSIPPALADVEVDKSGWSLWREALFCRPVVLHRDLIMLDDKGNVRHSIPISDILSPLGIPSNSHTLMTDVWALELNNLWDVFASS